MDHEAETGDGEAPFQFGWRAVLLSLAFWTIFAVLNTTSRLLDDYRPAGPEREIAEAFYFFFESYLWAAATPFIFWLVWRFGFRKSPWVSRLLLLAAVGLVMAACKVFIDDAAWVHVLGFPRGRSSPTLLARLTGPVLFMDFVTYAGIVGGGYVREFILRYQARLRDTIRLQAQTASLEAEAARLEAQSAQLRAQLADARLESLRHQLNPHFLFNTLNAVSTLVARDPQGVRRMIARLSDLLRYSLEGPRQREIPLRDELKLLVRYLEILEIRYDGRLSTEISADPGVLDALVPTLILQPLAENAMTHGVARAGGRGRIEVHAVRQGDRLILSVRDTGGGDGATPLVEVTRPGTGVGLRNTRARLAELYGDDQSLELREREEGGMIAEIQLPLRMAPDPEPGAPAVGAGRSAARPDA